MDLAERGKMIGGKGEKARTNGISYPFPFSPFLLFLPWRLDQHRFPIDREQHFT
jgi:hypothetical protein